MYQLILFYLLNAKHLSPQDKKTKHQLTSKFNSAKEIAKGANDV
tara:strand:- start:464 stop:595 length:132 start_codon:yes stop_codon:yes gene_type:complete